MNFFKKIKDEVSVKKAASFYGFKPGRSGMICCPFHNDKHPSMKVDDRFHCFGCGIDGDVINFVQKLFSLSATQAAYKLTEDLKLNIHMDRRASRQENRDLRVERVNEYEKKIMLAYEAELYHLRQKMTDIFFIFHRWEMDHAPESEEWKVGICDERYEAAMHNKDPVGYILDTLANGDDNEIYEIYKHRKEITDLYERRISEVEQRAVRRSGEGIVTG